MVFNITGPSGPVVNESGTVIERHDYDAYGMEMAGRGMTGWKS